MLLEGDEDEEADDDSQRDQDDVVEGHGGAIKNPAV